MCVHTYNISSYDKGQRVMWAFHMCNIELGVRQREKRDRIDVMHAQYSTRIGNFVFVFFNDMKLFQCKWHRKTIWSIEQNNKTTISSTAAATREREREKTVSLMWLCTSVWLRRKWNIEEKIKIINKQTNNDNQQIYGHLKTNSIDKTGKEWYGCKFQM